MAKLVSHYRIIVLVSFNQLDEWPPKNQHMPKSAGLALIFTPKYWRSCSQEHQKLWCRGVNPLFERKISIPLQNLKVFIFHVTCYTMITNITVTSNFGFDVAIILFSRVLIVFLFVKRIFNFKQKVKTALCRQCAWHVCSSGCIVIQKQLGIE